MSTQSITVREDYARDDDSITWVLSIFICLLLYLLVFVVGHWAWSQWNSLDSAAPKSRQPIALTTAAPEVIKQIQEIEVKKRQREIALEKEALALQDALKNSKDGKKSVNKITEKSVEKNKLVKKDLSTRSQAERFELPLGDLLAKSKALAQRSSVGLSQSTTQAKAFNFKAVAVDEKTEVVAKTLVADRLSGATYEGGLLSHAKGPEGLIFKPIEEEVRISEGLPLELIQMVVEENQIQLRYCYEIQLLKAPDLQGEVKSEWQISPEGVISQIQLASSVFEGSDFFSCLEKKMKSWKFPKPKGGVNVMVKYPMRFSKKEVM